MGRLTKLAGAVLAAVAVASLPLQPAHATLGPPIPVSMQLWSPTSQTIGNLSGSLQFDDGGQQIQYTLNVNRQSSFSGSLVEVWVNGVLYDRTGRNETLWSISAAPAFPYLVRNVEIRFRGGSYTGANVYQEHWKMQLYDNPYT